MSAIRYQHDWIQRYRSGEVGRDTPPWVEPGYAEALQAGRATSDLAKSSLEVERPTLPDVGEVAESRDSTERPRHAIHRRGVTVVIRAVLCVIAFAAAAAFGDTSQESEAVVVVMETSKGTLRIEMLPEAAPITVENFLAYVDSGFYDGTVFHRVIPGFVIQGGGFESDMVKRPTIDPIQNESDNGVLNLRGTLSMARTNAAHSATSQFFINLVDNAMLDYGARRPQDSSQAWGYAVFARVIEGMDVVDEIARVQTGQRAGMADVPVEPVVIERAYLETP